MGKVRADVLILVGRRAMVDVQLPQKRARDILVSTKAARAQFEPQIGVRVKKRTAVAAHASKVNVRVEAKEAGSMSSLRLEVKSDAA